MPKTPSIKLFNLIKSLSGSEKRYFKLYISQAKKTNKYVQLFDAIEQQKIYDDEALRQLIYANEEIGSRKFSELKAYLYDLILKSLQSFDEKTSVDYRLTGMLLSVRVLFKRGHYDDCLDMLKKALQLSNNYEAFEYGLKILQWKKRIAYTQMNIDFLNKELEEIKQAEKKYLIQLGNLVDYRNLFLHVLVQIKKDALLRSEKKVANLKLFIQHPLLVDLSEAKSFKAKVLYHRIYGLYYYSILNYQEFYKSSKKIMGLMEERPIFLKEDVSEYISVLSNLCLSAGILEKYEEVNEYLEKLMKIKSNTVDDELKKFRQYYQNKLNLCIKLGDFEEGVVVLERLQKDQKRYDQRFFETNTFYYSYFYIYFGIGDYDKALVYLNDWLSLKSIDRQDLQSLSRILNLIIHYELGNSQLLESLHRAASRFLTKQNRVFESEKKIIKFIRVSTNEILSRKEIKENIVKLKEDFLQLSKNPAENVIHQYFDFIAWMDSKILGENFGDVVKRKRSR